MICSGYLEILWWYDYFIFPNQIGTCSTCDCVIVWFFPPPSLEQIGMWLQQQEGIQNGAFWTVHSCKPDCRMGRVILPAQIPCPLFSEFLCMCTALMSNIGFIFVAIKLTDSDRIQDSVVIVRVVFFILNLRSLLGGKEPSIIPFFLRNLPVLKRSCDLVILSLGLQPKLYQHHFVIKISSFSPAAITLDTRHWRRG